MSEKLVQLEQKVYKFVEETKGVVSPDNLFLVVNDKLWERNGDKVKVSDLFVKMKIQTDMVYGWSPLQSLEVKDGYLVSDKAKISFVDSDGNAVRISNVRNNVCQMNDKAITEEVKELFSLIGDTDPMDDNEHIAKLKVSEYEPIKKDPYVLMYKGGSEPYLFMNSENGYIMLETEQVYANEDGVKYNVPSIGKHLTLDVKTRSITVE